MVARPHRVAVVDWELRIHLVPGVVPRCRARAVRIGAGLLDGARRVAVQPDPEARIGRSRAPRSRLRPRGRDARKAAARDRVPGPVRAGRIGDPVHPTVVQTRGRSAGSRRDRSCDDEYPHKSAAEIAPSHHASLLDDNNRIGTLSASAAEYKWKSPMTG